MGGYVSPENGIIIIRTNSKSVADISKRMLFHGCYTSEGIRHIMIVMTYSGIIFPNSKK